VQFCNLSANKMAGKDVLAQSVKDESTDTPVVTVEPTVADHNPGGSTPREASKQTDNKASDVGMNTPGTSL
jgi:hypothetical protein